MAQQIGLALDAAWRVLVVCLILGAGLPTLFTIGVKQLSLAVGPQASDSGGTRAAHRVLAIVLFAVVITAIVAGLTFIVAHGFGYSIKFDGILPVISKK